MATYRRRGHWRRGPGGKRHWVEPHNVTRSGSSGWGRQSSRTSYRPAVRVSPPRTWHYPRTFSERWLRPNARCPVCGAAVFFYSNEHGSRVYFDEVGPPWPKHPCTDSASENQRWNTDVRRSAPVGYGFLEGRRSVHDANVMDRAGHGGLTSVGRTYGAHAWTPHSLLKVEVGPAGTRLTMRRLYTLDPASVWTAAFALPLTPGDVVFLDAGQMSFFDTDRGQVVTLPVNHAGAADGGGILALLRGLLGNPPPTLPPAGWYTDPALRHAHRYWNGVVWTPHARAADGAIIIDPLT